MRWLGSACYFAQSPKRRIQSIRTSLRYMHAIRQPFKIVGHAFKIERRIDLRSDVPLRSWLKRAVHWVVRQAGAPDGPVEAPHHPSKRRVDLIPGDLSVDIYSHDVQAGTGPLACWSYVSSGLQKFGHPEVVFSLVKTRGEAVAPELPLKLIRTIHRSAQGGTILHAGAVHRFPNGEFFGRHIVYIAAQPLPGVEIPNAAICAVLVTDDESRASTLFGATRVIARLGAAAGYYPCPPWSDRSRPGIPFDDVRRASILMNVGPLPGMRSGCSVCQTKEGVVLSVDDESRKHLEGLINGTPDAFAFALQTAIDPFADGCFVWFSGQTQPVAISPPGSTGQRICGAFLLITTGQDENTVRQAEDGFAIILTAASWRAMKIAVAKGESTRIDAAGMPLLIEFTGPRGAIEASQLSIRQGPSPRIVH